MSSTAVLVLPQKPTPIIDFAALDKIFAEINKEFVGMDNVKTLLRDIAMTEIEYKAGLARGNVMPEKNSHHIVLAGNPGTGKTTIANYIGRILHATGYLEKSAVHTATRKDLVASFIGQTAPKVEAAIKAAMGGVLFIDEAGALSYSDSSRDFGNEVIQTLITPLENLRGQFVCVFASYPDEMERTLNADAGFKSRIQHVMRIDDFTSEQMQEIFARKLKDKGLTVSPEALIHANKLIERCVKEADGKTHGNGRLVRNIIEALDKARAADKQGMSFRAAYDLARKNGPTCIIEAAHVAKIQADILKSVGIEGGKKSMGFTADI
jgi:SpoVK/Ycf46/Vps4 family AAA+-type ATPase